MGYKSMLLELLGLLEFLDYLDSSQFYKLWGVTAPILFRIVYVRKILMLQSWNNKYV